MANVLDLLHPLAQPSMNGFDLSQKHVYGSAPGRIDAPCFIETMPRDKFKINVGALMRSLTPLTAPFLRGKVTFDFFFVPYSQLWHPFNQFIDQRKDPHSSLQKGISFLPVIHLYDLFKLIRKVYLEMPASYDDVPSYLLDVHGVYWYENIWNLLDFFGFGNFLWLKDLNEDADTTDLIYDNAIQDYKNRYVNVLRPAAYQHIWYDIYRNKFYDNYEFDYYSAINDYVTSFNFDDIQCDTFAHSIIPIDPTDETAAVNKRIYILFSQRYCQYKQDVFQSALPSQQFGAVSDVVVNLSNLSFSGITGDSSYTNPNLNYSKGVKDDVVFPSGSASFDSDDGSLVDSTMDVIQLRTPHSHPYSGSVSVNSPATFDVITLKRAEAIQKWRQNVLRAGNMVDDNFRAHWGVTPRYEADNNVLKLGSFEGSLNVNTVETTAQYNGTGNNMVGSLGSNVVCTISGKELNFKCSDFGVIVCMQYMRPESEYASTMLDRVNTLNEPFDFASPEFCNVGLNSINNHDFNMMFGNVDSVIGYASQYWWYKTAIDKCHGEYAKYRMLKSGNVSEFKGNSVMWCAPRDITIVYDGYRYKSSLYVTPDILDDMFDVKYFNQEFGLENQLTFNTYFDIKAIRPLTVVGLPNF